MSFPNFYVHGLFLGTLRMELGDESDIICPETNLRAHFEWLQKVSFLLSIAEFETITRLEEIKVLYRFNFLKD